MRFFITSVFLLSMLNSWSQSISMRIDSVYLNEEKTRSYSYYLPTGNSPKTALFFLEPAARGNLPISKYATLANKYHLLLVASNNSRNGLIEDNIKEADMMIEDAKNRFELNGDSIFISGFSGGARAALFYSFHRSVAGVIACGAGFPPYLEIKNPPVPYVALVGNEDMNFLELKEVNEKIGGSNVAILPFGGGHQWPPASDFESAIIWQLVRRDLNQYDKMLTQKIDHIIDSLTLNYRPFYAVEWLNTALNIYPDHPEYRNQKDSIPNNKPYKKQQKKISRIEQMERSQIRELIQAFQAIQNSSFYNPSDKKDTIWWQSQHAKIRKLMTKGGLYLTSAKRLEGFILAKSYENAELKLQTNHHEQAAEYYRIMSLFGTTDGYRKYFELREAILLHNIANAKKIIGHLSATGYSAETFQQDPFFQQYAKNDLDELIYAF